MVLMELREVSFSYPEQPVFHGLSFRLRRGERVGIVGPNGSGKTTLLHLLVGLVKPQAGEVWAFGRPRVTEEDFQEVRRRVGLVFQDPDDQLFCPTVVEDVAFGPLNLGASPEEARRIAAETLRLLGLENLEDRLVHRLSGGQKRLVAIAGVLAMRPEVLLLDEPTGDLDPSNASRLVELLRSRAISCVVVSHEVGFLREVCTQLLCLRDGALCPLGEPESVRG